MGAACSVGRRADVTAVSWGEFDEFRRAVEARQADLERRLAKLEEERAEGEKAAEELMDAVSGEKAGPAVRLAGVITAVREAPNDLCLSEDERASLATVAELTQDVSEELR
jgi:hypothetical protein